MLHDLEHFSLSHKKAPSQKDKLYMIYSNLYVLLPPHGFLSGDRRFKLNRNYLISVLFRFTHNHFSPRTL